MGKGAVIIVSAVLLVVCGVFSDCAKAKVTRSGDTASLSSRPGA